MSSPVLGTNVVVKPFIKWAGGKRSLVTTLLANVPKQYGRYLEPFLGGGSLFFALQPPVAVLSDINQRLILTYRAIRDDLDNLVLRLEQLRAGHNKVQYLAAREQFSTEMCSTEIAALFIYLNWTCYNGLYRVNNRGKFNVPIGSYTDPAILNEPNLRIASGVLQSADLIADSFYNITPQANDFFYLDPPYHRTFTKYSQRGFDENKQALLAEYCHLIDKVGGRFLASNSDTPLIRALYQKYAVDTVSAARSIAPKKGREHRASELLIRNY